MVVSESERFSTGWVLDLETEYRRTRATPLLQPAHWDPDRSAFELPALDAQAIHEKAWANLHRYSFSQDMAAARKAAAHTAMLDPEDRLACEVTSENVSIQATSTQALWHVLLALVKHGARCALLVTPVYFSIWEATQLLGVNTQYFDTVLRDGGRSRLTELLDKIRAEAPGIVVMSNPHYPTGVAWPPGAVKRIHEACVAVNATLVIDATHSGLNWGHGVTRLADESLASLERTAIVQSPAKALFLNGARFAHVLADSEVISTIEDNVHVTSGAISQFQTELATLIYSSQIDELENGKDSGLGKVQEANKLELAARFAALQDMLVGSPLRFYPASSGLFTMLECLSLPADWTQEYAFVRDLLFEHGTMTFSGSCYRASPTLNGLSLRVTLAVPRHDLMEGVRRMVLTEEDHRVRRP